MFKGYISNTIGRVQWTIHAQSSFLIPYLEQISHRISGKVKESADDTLLTIMRKDRYKILGEFEVFRVNEIQTYLVKMYKYSGLIQKVKQLFKNTRGFQEFNTTYVAAMKGVPVEVPVAYGERKHLFTKGFYLIIGKIERSCTLREYFRTGVSPGERRDVMEKFGTLSKNIHDSGVKQDDFSLDNFLAYASETGERRVILIDSDQYVDLHSGKNSILYALFRLAEQVSPFGTFSKDLSTHDFLVQMKGNRLECYLGNYTAFHINHHPVQKNRTVNTHIIKQLLQTNDT